MTSFRAERAAQRIQQEITILLAREISDPRLANVNVTRVQVSGDLRLAKIFVAPVSGDPAETHEMMDALTRATGYFRRHIAEALDLRLAPEIRFVLDQAIEKGEHFLRVLEEVQAGEQAAERAQRPSKKKSKRN